MAKKMYVVYCEDDGTYWCGLNTWDKQLRKAKVFHWLKYANEVHERYKELKLKNVEIRMEIVPENPSNADRIRAMSDEELAEVLGKLVHCGGCPMRDNCNVDDLPCDNVMLEWLQQPTDKGE